MINLRVTLVSTCYEVPRRSLCTWSARRRQHAALLR